MKKDASDKNSKNHPVSIKVNKIRRLKRPARKKETPTSESVMTNSITADHPLDANNEAEAKNTIARFSGPESEATQDLKVAQEKVSVPQDQGSRPGLADQEKVPDLTVLAEKPDPGGQKETVLFPDLPETENTTCPAEPSLPRQAEEAPDPVPEPCPEGTSDKALAVAESEGKTSQNKENKAGNKIYGFRQLTWPMWRIVIIFFLLGFGLGSGIAYYVYGIKGYQAKLRGMQARVEELEAKNKTLAVQLENSNLRSQNVQIGLNQMNKLFATITDPPAKPHYQTAGDGVIIYWLDGILWRRYHVYQAKGKRGKFKKLNKRSTKKNYIYAGDLKPGIWKYAVTAIDREGKETEMSEVLEITIRP